MSYKDTLLKPNRKENGLVFPLCLFESVPAPGLPIHETIRVIYMPKASFGQSIGFL